MSIKIAHEAPKSIFKEVSDLTDYSYCLVHLAEEDPEYLQLFKDDVEKGREVILDNSIFELGVSFDPDKYIKWIQEIKPTYYIIPDVLENYFGTITQAWEWQNKTKALNLPGKTIGVIQGKTYEDLVACYDYMDKGLNVDKIAISFDYSYYNYSFPHSNKLISWMMGRVKLIGDLLRDGVLNEEKPHHLLGNALYFEGAFYKDYKFIESVDTSNPVMFGLTHLSYANDFTYVKPSQKLFTMIDTPKQNINVELVMKNIETFRNRWNEY